MITYETIIQGGISIITFALGAAVAFAQQYFHNKRSRLKERYFELFRPFMQMNQFSYMIDVSPFSEWDIDSQLKVVELIRKKDYLAPKYMHNLIFNFIKSTTCLQGDDSDFAAIKDNAFNELYDAMKTAYIKLSKKLHYVVSPNI